MQKLLFIVNPAAGQKKIAKHLGDVISLFNRHGYEVTVYMTQASGDGTHIAMAHAGRFDLVVCAGGDGTLNEVITGLLRGGIDVPIGYIPCGSTNDFASTLKIPGNVMQAAQIIMDGVPHAHDVGVFGDRYFTYVASFGAFTRTSYTTPQNVKNALGHLAYWLEGIQELAQIRPMRMCFLLDGETVEDDFIFGAISNATVVGGVLTLDSRQVDLQDGKFELLLIRAPRDAIELGECIRALSEQKYDCGMITFRSFSKLTVYPNTPITWSLDGERAEGSDRIPIQNLQRAVRIIRKQEET